MKFKSPIISQASGSLAGATFAHNKGGLYMRARSIPTNPNTPQQQQIRSLVASLTAAWLNELDATQREGWEIYAANVPLLDRLGEPRNVTGLNHYVRSNVPRLQSGGTLLRIDDAPTVYNLGEYTPPVPGSVTVATDVLSLAFTATDAWATEDLAAMLVYCSRPQSTSINYFKGPYRYAGVILGDTPAPTSPASITVPFNVEAGQRVFVRAQVVRADGRLSMPFRGQSTGTV